MATTDTAPALTPAVTTDAVALLRQEFPILSERIHGKRLAYLDNAATTQKPREVLAAIECAVF